MPGVLTHSPADILRQMLVDLGLATDSGSWPAYSSGEPDTPDNCITVFDTVGTKHGRTQFDGEVQEHHGVQIRVRSSTHLMGWTKARAVMVHLDTQVYQQSVQVNGVVYTIHSVSRTSDVVSLGKEVPPSRRSLFTLNLLVSLRQE